MTASAGYSYRCISDLFVERLTAGPRARQGYMSEALRAVLGYAFDPLGLGLETVRWTALAGNEASGTCGG